MLTRPAGLSDDALRAVLGRDWGIEVASMRYRPVGFGSHHWEVVDESARERRWVSVDEFRRARQTRGERDDAAADGLRAALQAAVDLRAIGCAFVVAPVLTHTGDPFARIEDGFAVAVYPFVEGETFPWGTFSSPAHRRAALDLIIEVHTAPEEAARHARVDDFVIRNRDDLERGISPPGGDSRAGPYGRAASALLIENAERIRRVLRRYDDLVGAAAGDLGPTVLTHGEPHAGNTIRTTDGWCLVDWDTALVAPPERDLWSLETGDGAVIDAYRDATGVTPRAAMLDLYRVRWDLADIAGYVTRFRAPHEGTADDDKSWDELCTLIGHLPE